MQSTVRQWCDAAAEEVGGANIPVCGRTPKSCCISATAAMPLRFYRSTWA